MGVREFTRAESIALLRRLAPDLTEAEADRVAEAVGDLPLAVEQAGSLLADTGMAVDKYLRLLAERAQDVLDHDPGGAYPQSVAASWAVAFDRLAADDPTALDLLTVVAWCGPEPVPLSLLTDHPDAAPRAVAADRDRPAGAGALHRDPAPAGHGHGVPARHPAAPDPGRAAARPQPSIGGHGGGRVGGDGGPAARPDRTRQCAHRSGRVATLETVAAACPGRGRPRCRPRRGSGRGHPTPRSRRDVPARPAASPRPPLAPFERAYDVRRDKFGDDHPDTLTSASNLALNLWWLGEYQRARALDEDTLTRRRRILGEDHPDTLTSASQLANDLFGLGNYPQARELAGRDAEPAAPNPRRRPPRHPHLGQPPRPGPVVRWVTISRPGSSMNDTLTRSRRVLGEDHPDTLASASLLGLVLWSLGDYQQARQLLNDTFTRSRRVLGEDHPTTLLSASVLGLVLWSLGDYQQARQLQNDTLTRSRRVLGEDHLVTLRSASLLGLTLGSLGEHQQARQLQSDAFTRSRRVLGEDHPDTLRTASLLGLTLGSLGEHQQARQLQNDTLTRSRRVLGEDHPDTLRTASLLGLTLGSLGEHQQARQLQNDTLTRLRRVLGDDHPDTLTSASRLAADLRALGEYQQARALDEDTLARRRRVLGDDHPDTLTSANNLAADLRALGEPEET